MGRSGVLLTGFGGPDCLDACGPFMRELMGREPSEELVARVRARYERIGGSSPLLGIAGEIARSLSVALEATPVRVGMRYWHPYIGETLAAMAADGIERVVTLSLSPFESKVASGAYSAAVTEAAAALPGIEIVEAAHLGMTDGFLDTHADECRLAVSGLGWAGYEAPFVVMTAHSLPVEDLNVDDPYVSGLEHAAEEVARRSGLEEEQVPWRLCYQSKGNKPGEWLGPMVEDVVAQAAEEGRDAIAVCPVGFLTDHMETLYDLDIVLGDEVKARELGFARAAVPNAAPGIIEAMRQLTAPLL